MTMEDPTDELSASKCGWMTRRMPCDQGVCEMPGLCRVTPTAMLAVR